MKINEIGVTYTPQIVNVGGIKKVVSPEDAVTVFRALWRNDFHLKESFMALHLNVAKRILGYYIQGVGQDNACTVDIKEVVRLALLTGASSVIVAHNHPSGNTKPSQSDIVLTKNIKKALDYMNIPFNDHLILTKDGYTSMITEGYI